MASHSDFAPSSAERWLNCTASYLLSKDIKTEPSKYAEEGTFAHSVLEYYIKHGGIDYSLVALSGYDYKEMIAAIEDSKEYLDTFISDSKLLLIEKCFTILKKPALWGHIDYLIIKDNTLHIADFKYGKGKKIKVENNPQLKLYAYGAYRSLKYIANIEHIKLHIIQPRISKKGNFESCYQGVKDLEDWVEETVRDKIQEALTGGSYKDGAWCWFCPAKNICSYLVAKDYQEDC